METRNIIVMGASAGGMDAIRNIVAALPGAIFYPTIRRTAETVTPHVIKKSPGKNPQALVWGEDYY